jgi:hypothetical protein
MCHLCAERERLRQARAAMSEPVALEQEEPQSEAPPLAAGEASRVKVFVIGAIAAVAGAFLWQRFAGATGWPVPVLAVGVGWGVGLAARAAASGSSASFVPWFAAVIAAIGVMLGFGLVQMEQTFRTSPALAHDAAGVPLPLQALLFTAAAPTKLGLFDWLFAYLGIFAAWRVNRRRVDPAAKAPDAEAAAREPATVGAPGNQHAPVDLPGFPAAPPPMGPPREE